MKSSSTPFQRPSEVQSVMADKPKRVIMNLSVESDFKKSVQVHCAKEGISVSKFIIQITKAHLYKCMFP